MTLSERSTQNIWHPYTQMKMADMPIAIVKGDGAYVFDNAGKKYIDAVSSWWVNIHGHANKYIAEKVFAQMQNLEHVIFAGFTHQPAVELAERLLKHLPNNQKKIFYSDNGSTAVEVAVKMAMQYWFNKGENRKRIVAFRNAYHGDTFGAMSVSERSTFTNPFANYLFDVEFIDVPSQENKIRVFAQFEKLLASNDVCAFIFEPLIQGASGMIMYEPELLNEMIKMCKTHHTIAIADEVMTGFGRTGKFFATDYISEMPDIYCLSKGLTGGFMPMGITSATDEIYSAFLSNDKNKTFFHGHSYTANPVACSAALASLDLMEKDETWKNIKMIEELHSEFIKTLCFVSGILDIRQCGTIMAIELKTEEQTSYLNPLRDRLYNYFIENGIILRPLGNIIYILPPYCISKEDLYFIYGHIKVAIDQNT